MLSSSGIGGLVTVEYIILYHILYMVYYTYYQYIYIYVYISLSLYIYIYVYYIYIYIYITLDSFPTTVSRRVREQCAKCAICACESHRTAISHSDTFCLCVILFVMLFLLFIQLLFLLVHVYCMYCCLLLYSFRMAIICEVRIPGLRN